MAGTVAVELRAVTGEFVAKMREAGAEVERLATKGASSFDKLATVGKGALIGVVGASVAVGGLAIKSAADYQEALTGLVTGAGETKDNIKLVGDGMLSMAGQVGISAQDLAKGMYMIESAGYHGADGLSVLRAAAEGAKVGNADMGVTADALTTIMKDYNIPAGQAAATTSKLVETVASGKTHMADLAGAMSAIAPIASKAGVSLQEMLGAMATMTGEGVSAQEASQNLAGTISSLQNPTSVQTKEMAQMGLSSLDVAKNLGKDGLTGTLDELSQAVLQHMGPSGLVLENAFNQSKIAAASANEMLTKLPPSLQTLGKEFLNNQITQHEWMKSLKGQDVLTANLGRQFATTAKGAHGFNETLRAGGGAAKTYNAAMADMTGGQPGLATSLALAGTNMKAFKANVSAIGSASAEAGGHVKGFGDSQKDLNAKIADLKAGFHSLLIEIGQKLIPIVTDVIDWFKKHAVVAEALAAVIGGVLVITIGAYVVKLAAGAATSVESFGTMLAAGAAWVAETVAGFATAAAAALLSFGAMAAEAAVWAAGMLVAGATALLPFAPLILIVAAVGAAAYELYRHWDEVWGFIRKAVDDAWKLMKPVFGFIKTLGLDIISGAINGLKAVWDAVWTGVSTAVSTAWNVLKPVFGFIKTLGLDIISGAVTVLQGVWETFWGGLHVVVDTAWKIIQPIIDTIKGAVSSVSSAIGGLAGAAKSVGGAVGSVTSFLGFADGGYVPGAKGAAQLAVVHGGEYIVSNEMQAGREPLTTGVALTRGAGGVGGGVVVHPGAVQLHVHGGLDTATLPQVQSMIDHGFGELTRELVAGRAA